CNQQKLLLLMTLSQHFCSSSTTEDLDRNFISFEMEKWGVTEPHGQNDRPYEGVHP
ncbi:hypothetical protein L9F63_022506, partial [Diploptera punctata]